MLYDISPPLLPGMPVWPGDSTFENKFVWQIGAECPVNVGRISLSTHTGAHADAPLHFIAGAESAGEMVLDPYLGPCRVVHCLDAVRVLGLEAIKKHLSRFSTPLPERVLLRSYSRSPTDRWDPDFQAISPTVIHWLAGQGVRLIGVDVPSLDPPDSKSLPAHNAVAHARMSILEQLLLDEVPEGDYELIALPLRLVGLDASPVRAILRPLA